MNGQSSEAAPSRQASASSNHDPASSITNPPAAHSNEDDEEEEGMVKGEEEGQIQEDFPAINRLHPPPSSHGGNSPQPSDHDRDRSRYYGTSPDPSSSYAAARSAHGQTPEAGYPAGYPRDAARNDAHPGRPSFSGVPPRGDGPRHSYGSVSSASSSRTPDVYRPAGRDREREWDIARERERELEWAHEREQDPYRYRDMEARREWEHRERSMMHYETSDYPPIHSAHSPYGPTSRYAFDTREYGRAPSPGPPGHDRSFERERWDRATDRSRSQSAAWGMRSWGKPSDAGWDSRQRRTFTEAGSGSPNRALSANNTYTPPPQTAERPSIASPLSDRGDVRNRESSPRSIRSAGNWQADSHLGTGRREASPRVSPLPAQSTSGETGQASGPQDGGESSAPQEKSLLERMNESPPPTEPVNAGLPASDGAEPAAQIIQPAASATSEAVADNDAAPVSAPAPEPTESSKPASADGTAQDLKIDAEEQKPEPEAVAVTQADGQPDAPAPVDGAPAASPPAEAPAQPMDLEIAPEPVPPQPEAKAEPSEPTKAEETVVREPEKDVQDMEVDNAEIAPVSSDDKVAATVPAPTLEGQATETEGVENVATKAEVVDEPSVPGEAQPAESAQQPVEEQTAQQPVEEAPALQPLVEEQPAQQSVEEQPAQQPVEEQPAQQLVEEKPEQQPVEEKPVQQPVEEQPAQQPMEEQPVQQAVEEQPAQQLVEEQPAQQSVEQQPEEKPAQQPVEEQLVQQPVEATATPVVSSVSLPAVSSALEAADVSTIARYARAEEAQRQHLDSQQPTVHEPTPVAQASDSQITTAVETATTQADTVVPPQPVLDGNPDSKQALLSQLEDATQVANTKIVETAESAAEPASEQPAVSIADSETLAVPAVKPEPSSADVSMAEVSAELGTEAVDMAVDDPTETQAGAVLGQAILPAKQDAAPETSQVEPAIVPASDAEASVGEPMPLDGPPAATVPVSTAASEVPAQLREVMLPRLGAEAPEDAKEETARMQELEIIPSREPHLLDIAAIDGIDKDIEPPMLTPKTQEQVDMVTRAGILRALAHYRPSETECYNITHENQKLAQSTTMDLLHAKIHGIPLSVSDQKPLWIDGDDADVARSKAYILDQMMDRQKRMNKKVEALKSRYRTINAEWKLHCTRLDRIAERREQQQRRQPMATPSGTPAGAPGDEPSNGGSGILGAALLTGRANRRNTQTGFAGFGDAVRSEAEFLEILASLENADMQDPSVRAARTTATAPDMQLDAYHNRPLEETYDDINGFIADPLAFYLDKFDPDVWTDDEKAIFARRYALWPKQFGKIAQALPHKSPSQCVRYYYLNKKAPGNDFKALAAARNRERKRKARGKPKKAKGSALMADLKSAKGEELEEDDGGVGSPGETPDGAPGRGDTSGTVTPRRGGPARSRMPTAQSDSGATVGDESVNTPHGKKRSAAPDGRDSPTVEGKSSEKRRSTPKNKRAKTSDSAKLGDKFKKARTAAKLEPLPAEPMREAVVAQQLELPATEAGNIDRKQSGVEDSDLAAAEALGALASMFGGGVAPKPADSTADTSFERPDGTADGDSQKPGKKRKSKGAVPGQEDAEPGSKGGRSKQPTSSYWSVAERSEFLRALALHGKHWEIVSSTLSQKSAAQARNYFARNGSEPDFVDAATLADKNHDLTLAEREAAATLFVRQRSAANAAQGNVPASQPPMPPATGTEPTGAQDAPRTTYLPPPPALSSSVTAEPVDLKRREESREPVTVRRGLQINSLLNSSDDTAETRTPRRLSDQEWQQSNRGEAAHDGYEGREGSLPVSAYSRRTLAVEPEQRPSTAGDLEIMRPSSAEDRPSQGEGRSRMYEPFGVHRQAPSYASMAPPHYPADRYPPSQPSRYSLPPPNAPSLSRSMTPHHLTSEGSESAARSEYSRYSAAPPDYRGHKEHESQSLPPLHSSESRHTPGYEKHSPTNSSFPSSLHASYGRYSSPAGSVGSLYSSASRRSIGGPGSSLGPPPSERSTSDHRWQRPSASPGPPGSGGSASGYGSTGGAYSTGNTYRSTGHAYSSNYPSQNLPRPSLPSVSSTGRSLPPLLGTFPGSGPRPLGSSRPRPSDDSQRWPHSQHDSEQRE